MVDLVDLKKKTSAVYEFMSPIFNFLTRRNFPPILENCTPPEEKDDSSMGFALVI